MCIENKFDLPKTGSSAKHARYNICSFESMLQKKHNMALHRD